MSHMNLQTYQIVEVQEATMYTPKPCPLNYVHRGREGLVSRLSGIRTAQILRIMTERVDVSTRSRRLEGPILWPKAIPFKAVGLF